MSETRDLPMRYEGEDYEPELPEISERSRTVALILGCLGGFLGFHRFYVGRIASGVAQALTETYLEAGLSLLVAFLLLYLILRFMPAGIMGKGRLE